MSKTHRLQVLIPPELHGRIAKEAQRTRLSQGEWVRRVIEKVLNEQRLAADPVAALGSLEAPTADIGQMLAEIEAGRR